jgi:hypothetical protein
MQISENKLFSFSQSGTNIIPNNKKKNLAPILTKKFELIKIIVDFAALYQRDKKCKRKYDQTKVQPFVEPFFAVLCSI